MLLIALDKAKDARLALLFKSPNGVMKSGESLFGFGGHVIDLLQAGT